MSITFKWEINYCFDCSVQALHTHTHVHAHMHKHAHTYMCMHTRTRIYNVHLYMCMQTRPHKHRNEYYRNSVEGGPLSF